MACVGLITFAEMGSSHSLHYVLYSEDDSFLCACVCVCVCNESYVSLLFCFCYMLCERAGDLYHLSMHRCVRVCFSAAQFVIGMISCMHLSAFVSENELQKCACIAREGEIDSVTQFVCVSH